MKFDVLAATAVLLVVGTVHAPLRAEPAGAAELPSADEPALRTADVATLKRWYLACDRASRAAMLDRPVAQACSITADALMQRAFDGDFDRLIAWWRSAREATVAQAAR